MRHPTIYSLLRERGQLKFRDVFQRRMRVRQAEMPSTQTVGRPPPPHPPITPDKDVRVLHHSVPLLPRRAGPNKLSVEVPAIDFGSLKDKPSTLANAGLLLAVLYQVPPLVSLVLLSSVFLPAPARSNGPARCGAEGGERCSRGGEPAAEGEGSEKQTQSRQSRGGGSH